MALLQPGTRLDGRYEVLHVVGQGGMATVYKVRHLELQSLHALKVLNPELAVHDEVRLRFLSEGRIQARLRSPHIVQVTEVVTAPVAGRVMEYVAGGSLADHLRAQGPARDVGALREVFLPVLDGLAEAHAQGVIHRELKPANILMGRSARGRLQPALTDFGSAPPREGGGVRPARRSAKAGTVQYMSPEQVRGADGVDSRSDIFSLGAILYELATGARAFQGPSDLDTRRAILDGQYVPPGRWVTGLDPGVAACVQCALSVSPGDRYQTCDAFAQALQGGHDGDAPSPVRGGASPPDTVVQGVIRAALAPARANSPDELFLAPGIPERKLAGARTYVHPGDGSPLVAVYDNTVFGSATEGFVLTVAGISWHNIFESPRFCRWEDVSAAESHGPFAINLYGHPGAEGRPLLGILQVSSGGKGIRNLVTDALNQANRRLQAPR